VSNTRAVHQQQGERLERVELQRAGSIAEENEEELSGTADIKLIKTWRAIFKLAK
jgi:hypothetical protein